MKSVLVTKIHTTIACVANVSVGMGSKKSQRNRIFGASAKKRKEGKREGKKKLVKLNRLGVIHCK